jgi:hypothetical protein
MPCENLFEPNHAPSEKSRRQAKHPKFDPISRSQPLKSPQGASHFPSIIASIPREVSEISDRRNAPRSRQSSTNI